MNIAFICGGLPRLNQECIDNFYNKIISKLNPEKNYFKFFISVDQEHFDYWNSFDYKVDRDIKITDKNLIFEKCIFSQLIDLGLEPQNYYHQYRHLWSSFLNLKNENLKFDCIFKIRLDMMYCNYFEFDVSLIEDNCLYTPCKEFHEENDFNLFIFCNDQFYFGNYNTMSKIMNFSFDENFKIYDYFTVKNYPSLELMLRKYLHFKSINLILIRNFIYYKHLDLPGKRGFIPECANSKYIENELKHTTTESVNIIKESIITNEKSNQSISQNNNLINYNYTSDLPHKVLNYKKRVS